MTPHAALPRRELAVLRRLFEEGQDRAELGISAASYGKIARASLASATRDLAELEGKGAMARAADGGRSTRYLLNW
ncbi:hypothetical protein [Pseudooceanicola lipolyticus]|uniref:hypothetical protein n=1 Tax=Pseudooceanicola lipolyticus TaxID=2029104 RepID=UPI00105578FF|nr:hypothetical protein [Pseudooceanicola lipolyticus]